MNTNRMDELRDLVTQLLQAHQLNHGQAVERIASDLFYIIDQYNEEEMKFVMNH